MLGALDIVELGRFLVVEYEVDDGDKVAITLVDVWDPGTEDEDITLDELDRSWLDVLDGNTDEDDSTIDELDKRVVVARTVLHGVVGLAVTHELSFR